MNCSRQSSLPSRIFNGYHGYRIEFERLSPTQFLKSPAVVTVKYFLKFYVNGQVGTQLVQSGHSGSALPRNVAPGEIRRCRKISKLTNNKGHPSPMTIPQRAKSDRRWRSGKALNGLPSKCFALSVCPLPKLSRTTDCTVFCRNMAADHQKIEKFYFHVQFLDECRNVNVPGRSLS